ncbi:J domain-containing protein [Amorphus suaedae]
MELLRAPAMADVLRQQSALPDDIDVLIRLAGGCVETRERLSTLMDQPGGLLVKAARFYLEQVLFHAENDSYRILGLTPDASPAAVREHGRWLLRWLHPDNDHSEWDAAFAGRITTAWNDLKTPARRAAYDRTVRADRARAFQRRRHVHLAPPLIAGLRQKPAADRRRRVTWRTPAAGVVFLAGWLIPFDLSEPLPSDPPVASCIDRTGTAAVACEAIPASPSATRVAGE